MAQDWTVTGVPTSIARDGWWLHKDVTAAPAGTGAEGTTSGGGAENRTAGGGTGRRSHPRLLALAALVALGDALFYGHAVGLSLAVFALVLFAVATLPLVRLNPGAWVVMLLSVLPVVEHVQALSIALMTLGLMVALMWALRGPQGVSRLPGAVLGLLRTLPGQALRDGIGAAVMLNRAPRSAGRLSRLLRDWAFPVGGALVLMSLLVRANPVLGDWLGALGDLPLNPRRMVARGAGWVGLALMIWPMLVADRARPVDLPQSARPARRWLTANAVTHSLVGFNAILALQTLLDLRYLWSGFAPPAGMTLAEYAHRGAYPLLATALLAGAFALAARPWLDERRVLKPLMLLWIAQNVLLALSAVYRLDLYVQTFGLTYLRVHAGIWMLLVAAGLALILGQVAADRPNRWLMLRCAALGLGTLYACAFINFAAVIARHNVARIDSASFDRAYLCSLGPTAAAEIPSALRLGRCAWDNDFRPPRIDGWRDWGYRDWRVLRYLERPEQPEVRREDSRRG